MRICLVGPTYPFRGGIAHYNTVLYKELSKRHEVFLVSMRKLYPKLLFPGKTQNDESREILAVDNTPMLTAWNPLSWRRAARHIERLTPDLVIVQWWHPFFGPCFGSLAASLRRRGIPVVFLAHNGKAHEGSFVDGWLTRYAFRSAAAFIAHSEQDAAALLEARPGASVRVSPHPTYDCFARTDSTSPGEARRRLGLPDRDTLLFFGYIRRYKGLPILLRALPSLLERHDCRLLVVGEFYHGEDEIRALVRDLDLEERVTIVDRYVANEEIQPYFDASDAVVLPYLSASQSGIVQIAYGLGLPVVATRVGGLPEVVEEGTSGFLCEPNDPASLTEAIERFLGANRETLRRGVERYRDRFSWDRMVEVIEAIGASETSGPPSSDSQRATDAAVRDPAASDSTTAVNRRETTSAS